MVEVTVTESNEFIQSPKKAEESEVQIHWVPELTAGINIFKSSRLDGTNNDAVYDNFQDRISELVTLRRLCSIIKKELKNQKQKLLKERSKEEVKIFSL